jgi:hypothetical protein
MMTKKRLALAACVGCLAVTAPTAAAQTEGYNPVPGVPPGTVGHITAAATPSTPAPAEELPFTGADLALVIAAALVLVGLGLVVRRSSNDVT